jgi:ornithine cyclodeaminase/alanine dehydrogenase-like protein (mu-crystallin family)
MSAARGTLILSRSEIAGLMQPRDYLEAVELGFRAAAEARASAPPPLSIEASGGAFHAKGALLVLGRPWVALKLNGNFPGNPARNGMPTIQGAILLCDGATGALVAVMDSIEITLGRTAAATALAARYLARPDSAVLGVIGCGEQAFAQVAALADILPISRCLLHDLDAQRAEALADRLRRSLSLDARVTPEAAASDVVVTCTTARTPILDVHEVRPGAFVAAVGADNPHKNEIAPALMAAATVVVDRLDQCLAMGDLRHAVAAGAVSAADVHADLGELILGAKQGRTSPEQITLLDSTGTALQDVASAVAAFERASGAGIGQRIAFGAQLEEAA